MTDFSDRGQFLNLSAIFEGSLVVVAFLLGWLLDVDPVQSLAFRWSDVLWGAAAALPIFAAFLLAHLFPLGPLKRIKRFLVEVLGPPLSACRWYDLLLLAGLAGLAEEILFRGLLQPWLEQSLGSRTAGLIGSNIVFGLAHLITPVYALAAAIIGLYLGFLLDATGQRSLLVPIVTHAVYDYLAFLVVRRAYRQRRALDEDGSNDGGLSAV